MAKTYFAANPGDQLIKELDSKVKDCGSSWLENIWARNRNAYESLEGDGQSGLGSRGSQNEYLKMTVNEARRLVRDFVSLITKDRLAFSPAAEVSDATVLWDSRVAKALCEHIVNQFQLEHLADKLAESAAVNGEGYLFALWNPWIGENFSADGAGRLVKKGDIELSFCRPEDVLFDSSKPFTEAQWARLKRKMNKHDLAAIFPDHADRLLSLSRDAEDTDFMSLNDDDISVYYFFHRDTPACQGGRHVIYAGNIVLVDDVNPYPESCIPGVQMCPESLSDEPGHGFALFSLLLPLQEMLDSSYSTVATNQATFGVQSIAIPDGQDISVQDIGGLSFIRYTPNPNAMNNGMPTALQLTKTPPEVFNFIQDLRSELMNLSNINGALRGNPPSGATSGISIATLSANAIELTQSYRKSYILAMEKLMTIVVRIFHKFATVERTIQVTGKNNSFLAQQFKGDDLKNIKHVALKTSNPMAQTAAGRMTMAQDMLQAGFVKSAPQYLQVIETGNFEVLVEPELQEQTLIQSENEAMERGEQIKGLSLDAHQEHILRHKAILSNPSMRNNQQVAGLVLNHIMEHIELARNTDPYLTAIIQTGQLPPPPQEMAPPQAQG